MVDAPSEESSLQDWLGETLRGWGPADARAMFGSQTYLVGGKMFVALGKMGLLLKLPPQAREPLLREGRAESFTVSSGASFGEWVALLPDRWQHDRQTLLSLVRQSYDYVQSAPPPAKPPREPRRFRKRQY